MIKEEEGLYCQYIYKVKTKALTSCRVTTQLICAFVFEYKKGEFLRSRLICKQPKRLMYSLLIFCLKHMQL